MSNRGWLSEWWDQLARKPVLNPWDDDPEIMRERDRQHRLGISDAITIQRIRESEFWCKRRIAEHGHA